MTQFPQSLWNLWSATARGRLRGVSLTDRHPLTPIAALLLTLLIPATIQPQSATFRISGTVLNSQSSTALSQTRIILTDTRNPANVLSMLTSDNGRFDFPNLSAGKFSLQGTKRGYVPSYYDQHENFSTAIVTGPGLTSENLIMRLTPFGAISGKVLDESGEPVRNASVALYFRRNSAGIDPSSRAGGMTTDDQGSFELSALAPGDYFIAVNAQAWYAVHPPLAHPAMTPNLVTVVDSSLDVAYPITFYDSATDPSGATPVALRGGDRLQLDIRLTPVPALHVIFHVPTEGPLANNVPILRRIDAGSLGFVGTHSAMSVPGFVEVSGIPPGKYSMRTLVPGLNYPRMEIDLRKDGQEFTISDTPQAGADLKFSVAFLRDSPLPKSLSIRMMDSMHQWLSQPVDPQGHATFASVNPTSYNLGVTSDTRAYPIVRATSQGQPISVSPLNVSLDATLDITLVLTDANISINGFVKHNGHPVAGAMVVILSTESTSDFLRRDQTDSDGSFSLPAVPPGSYKVIALEDAWTTPWPDTATLRQRLAQAQPITVTPISQSRVELPVPLDPQPR
jgi:hypothetical protein